MSALGKRIIVFTMFWVLLVMALSQLYDNVTGKGMPVKTEAVATAEPTVQVDETVSKMADLQTCVAADPKNLQCTLDLANLYYTNGLWAQAQETYESAVNLNPHDPAVLLKLAGAYIYQSQFDKAIPTLQQAVALKPDAPEIHLLLGLALSKSTPAQTGAAVTEWRKVVTLAPGSAWASQAAEYISEAGR